MAQAGKQEILELATEAGKLMLENGAEIYRVEQTMYHVSMGLGAVSSESYASPTAIVLTIMDAQGKAATRMRRITGRQVNLDRVEALNTLSREMARRPMTVEETAEALEAIGRRRPYSLGVNTLASAFGAGAFALMFQGGLVEFLLAAGLGALLALLVHCMSALACGSLLTAGGAGAFGALGGKLCALAGLTTEWEMITLSVLMLMVPGMLFTNALRDTAAGDLVSGLSRAAEALCVAVALAFGAVAAYAVLGAVWGV